MSSVLAPRPQKPKPAAFESRSTSRYEEADEQAAVFGQCWTKSWMVLTGRAPPARRPSRPAASAGTIAGHGPAPGDTVPTWTTRQGYRHRCTAREPFKRHRLDWMAFLRDGIDADQLIATGDALAPKLRLSTHARRC
ncbi:hypothetical protein P4050_30530 [Pseudomonas aeruginosa]|nr:hypothetical protein [Pseudomonas aeruginosa]